MSKKSPRKSQLGLSKKAGLTFKAKNPALVLKPKTQDQNLKDKALKEKQEQERQFVSSQKEKENFIKLKEMLLNLFNEKEWENEEVEDKLLIFKHKRHKDHVIEIRKDKEEIKFSGNPIEKVIDLANNYEQTFGEMVYEIEASDLNTALNFLLSLNEHGFEINKVKNLRLKSNEPYDLKKIIEDIKKPPAPTPGI